MSSTTERESSTAIAKASTTVSVPMGIAPTGIDEAWRLAKMVSESTIVPRDFQGKPANVLIAIEAGMEVGIPWMQAVQGSAIINGRHGFYGDLFLAIIVSSAVFEDHDEYFLVGSERREVLTPEDLKLDTTAAVCEFKRKGRLRPTVRSFSIAQAKRANLLGKEGPWQHYPDRQLRMRARSLAGRDAFPDVLKGMRPVEELRDTPPETPPIDAEPVQPRRASASTTEPKIASREEVKDLYAEGVQTGIDLGKKMHPEDAAAHLAAAETSEPREASTVREETPPSEPMPAAPRNSTAPPCEVRPARITRTEYVTPQDEDPYYAITAENANGYTLTFRTRDELLYKEALSFEGTPHAVAITYALRYTKAKRTIVMVLESIAIDDTTAPASPPPTTSPDLPLFPK